MFYDIIEHFILHTERVGCTLAAIPVCGIMKGECWLMSIFSETEKKSYQMKQSSFNTKIEKKRCYKRQDSWRSKHSSFRNSFYAESNLIHTFPVSPAAFREQQQMAAVLIFAVRKKTHWVKHRRVSCSKRVREML